MACKFLDTDQILSGNNFGEIQIWDASTGEISKDLVGLPFGRGVSAVGLSSDGVSIIAANLDGVALAWNRVTGELLDPLLAASSPRGTLPARIDAAGFLRDDTPFVGSRRRGVLLLPKLQGQRGSRGGGARNSDAIRTVYPDSVSSAVGLSDGRIALATGNHVMVIDPKSGAWTGVIPFTDRIRGLDANAHTSSLVAGDARGTVRVWDIGKNESRCTHQDDDPRQGTNPKADEGAVGSDPRQHTDPKADKAPIGPVWAVAFHPEGARFAVSGTGKAIHVLDSSDCRILSRLEGLRSTPSQVSAPPASWKQSAPCNGVLIPDTSKAPVLLSDDRGWIRVWAPDPWRQVGLWRAGVAGPNHFAFVSNGTVATIESVRAGRIMSFCSRDQRNHFPGDTNNAPVALVAVDDEETVLVGDQSGSVIHSSFDGGWSFVYAGLDDKPMVINAIAVRPRAREAVIATGLGITRKVKLSAMTSYEDWSDLAPLPKESRVAKRPTATTTPPGRHGEESSSRGHKAPAEQEVKVIPSVVSLSYSPDGRLVVQGTSNGMILIRDADTGDVKSWGSHETPSKAGIVALAVAGNVVWAGDDHGQIHRIPLIPGDKPTFSVIKENSAVYSLTVTPDNRYLVVTLWEGGPAIVHSLPRGEVVAHLYTMNDGSWATVLRDDPSPGRVRVITSGKDALKLQLRDKEGHIKTIQGDVAPTEFSALSIKPTPTDKMKVTGLLSTPLSRSDLTLRFDGGASTDVTYSLTESKPGVYTFTIFVERGHEPVTVHLTALISGLPLASLDVAIPSNEVRRALVIGNESYKPNPDLPRVKVNAEAMVAALRRADGWNLDASRLDDALIDKTAEEMRTAIRNFLTGKSAEGATLLLYFAGHGIFRGGDYYLLAKDAPVVVPPGGDKTTMVSASEINGWISQSPAAKVLVILDACQSGAYHKIPIPARAKVGALTANDTAVPVRPEVGALTATDPKEDTIQGVFTDVVIKALKGDGRSDGDNRPVTVDYVYGRLRDNALVHKSIPQTSGTLAGLVLAWPSGPSAGHINAKGSKPSVGPLAAVEAYATQGAVSTDLESTRVELVNSQIVVNITFREFTHVVSLEIRREDNPRAPFLRHSGPGGPQGTTKRIAIPVERLPAMTYIVKATPCDAAGVCRTDATVEFPLDLTQKRRRGAVRPSKGLTKR